MKYLFGLIVVVILISSIYSLVSRKPQSVKNYDGFAQCLADKKLTMYGAYWCPHCQNEKKIFGDSIKYVPYIECTQETKKCLDAGITSYPTWITATGQKYSGEQGLLGLSKISGCVLP